MFPPRPLPSTPTSEVHTLLQIYVLIAERLASITLCIYPVMPTFPANTSTLFLTFPTNKYQKPTGQTFQKNASAG